MLELSRVLDEQSAADTARLSTVQELRNATEVISSAALPMICLATLAHEANPLWTDGVPGINHASSVTGSAYLAGVITFTAETLANRHERTGNSKTAEHTRRLGLIAAWSGSVVCQLTIEMSKWGGVSDKKDILAGFLATAPGIIYGQRLARR